MMSTSLLQGCNRDVEMNLGSNEGLGNTINRMSFMCGPCKSQFKTVKELHRHLEGHMEDNSYLYNHTTRTVYLLNGNRSSETQTVHADLTEGEELTSRLEDKALECMYLPVKQEVSADHRAQYDGIKNDSMSAIREQSCDTSTGELVIKQEVVNIEEDVIRQQHAERYLRNSDVLQTKETDKSCTEGSLSFTKKMKRQKVASNQHLKSKKRGRPRKNLPKESGSSVDICGVSDILKCNVCSEKFQSLKCISEHVYEAHAAYTVICCLCWKVFLSKAELEEHLSSHQVKQSSSKTTRHIWHCNLCGKNYATSSAYSFHKRIKHKNERAKCNICDLDFSSPQTLSKHKIEQHFTKITGHYCELCKRQFAYKYHYEKHMIGVHKDMSLVTQTYICEKCGFRAFDIGRLNDHKQSCLKEKLLTCSICEYTTYRKNNLRVHLTVHTNERNHMCHYCGLTFRKRTVMLTHQRVHTGEKPYKCDVCGSCFAFESPFKRHKDLHKDTKAHKCTYCGKEFHQKSNCQAHMRQHTGEKPFKCDYCGQGFTHNVSRKNHMTKCPSKMQTPVNLTIKNSS